MQRSLRSAGSAVMRRFSIHGIGRYVTDLNDTVTALLAELCVWTVQKISSVFIRTSGAPRRSMLCQGAVRNITTRQSIQRETA